MSAVCEMCRGLFWVDVIRLKDGTEHVGAEELDRVLQNFYDLIVERIVRECKDCSGELLRNLMKEHGQKYEGRLVTMKLIEEAWKKRKTKKNFAFEVPKFAANVPEKSILLYGETGRFKTLILQFWFNCILHKVRGDASQLLWIREDQIVTRYLYKESKGVSEFIDILKNPSLRFLCMDEVLAPENLRGGEHHANLVRIGLAEIWDYLCTNKDRITVWSTTNATHDQVNQLDLISGLSGEEWVKTLRRFEEVYERGLGKVKV